MSEIIKEFNDYREKMNEVILSKNNLVMKRLWNLDTNTYQGQLHLSICRYLLSRLYQGSYLLACFHFDHLFLKNICGNL